MTDCTGNLNLHINSYLRFDIYACKQEIYNSALELLLGCVRSLCSSRRQVLLF